MVRWVVGWGGCVGFLLWAMVSCGPADFLNFGPEKLQECNQLFLSGKEETQEQKLLAVDCTYTVGGTLSNYFSSNVTLQNNGGDNLTVTSEEGSFTFSTKLSNGATYSVTVFSSPERNCVVSSGSGTISRANVTSVSVTCSPL